MQQIECVAVTHFEDSVLGSVTRKRVLHLEPHNYERLRGLGLVRLVGENPPAAAVGTPQQTEPPVAGGDESPVSLQAAQVSPPTTVSSAASLAGDSSQSTTHGEPHRTQTPSTPATASGGKSTTPKSKLSLPVKSGPKTKARRGDTD